MKRDGHATFAEVQDVPPLKSGLRLLRHTAWICSDVGGAGLPEAAAMRAASNTGSPSIARYLPTSPGKVDFVVG